MMQTFQVQLWPNGKWDKKPYQKIEAETAKEAAEKLYGKALKATGQNFQIRAQVRQLGSKRNVPIVLYEV